MEAVNPIERSTPLQFSGEVFDRAIEEAKQRIRGTLIALQSVTCPELTQLTIRLPQLTAATIEQLLEGLPTGYRKGDKGADHIYIIELSADDLNAVEQLQRLLTDARLTATDYSRINTNSRLTRTLYVGRSRTLKARLRQHLGAEEHDVFALHLGRWAKSADIEITITILQFADVDTLIVQAIEDGLWLSCIPAFGRLGEK